MPVKDENRLKTGYTTGTCAAAAALGAARWLVTGSAPEKVTVKMPGGEKVTLKVHPVEKNKTSRVMGIIKDAGSDPDVTHGAEIRAAVELNDTPGVTFRAGKGVGTVTRPGLQVPVGEPAINPVPRKMIRENLADLKDYSPGWTVTVSVVNGEKLAEKTRNAQLGIIGGVSIIGTTGYVLPRSQEAVKKTILAELDVAKASGALSVCLVPGNIGRKAAKLSEMVSQDVPVVEYSDFLGFTAEQAAARFRKIIFVGHPGKLAKTLNNDFKTHSKDSPPANTAVIEFLASHGLDEKEVRELKKLPLVESIQTRIIQAGKTNLLDSLAGEIRNRLLARIDKKDIEVKVFLCDMQNNVTGGTL